MRIGFSSGASILSLLIKKLTHSKASHSYIVFKAAGQELVIQANQHGVCCEHYESFRKRSKIVAEYDLLISENQENVILGYALSQLLKPFDTLALFGFAWVLLNKSFGRKTGQPFDNKSAYYCSELIVASLQAANFTASHMLERELASPEDIIDFLDCHLQAKIIC